MGLDLTTDRYPPLRHDASLIIVKLGTSLHFILNTFSNNLYKGCYSLGVNYVWMHKLYVYNVTYKIYIVFGLLNTVIQI